MPTLLDYLRHGEPIGGSRYRGSAIDDPLSDKGWTQMRNTTDAFQGWTHIVTSPLSRCLDFAQWLSHERNLSLETHHDLREVGFGSWEGLSRADIIATHPAAYAAFYQDPVNNRPEGAEPLDQFSQRISQVFTDLAEKYAGEHLLIIAHAGVIRATLGYVTQAPAKNWYRTAVDNAGLSRFAHDQHGSKLLMHNWHPQHATQET